MAVERSPKPGTRAIRRALISVTDKTGVVELGRHLADAGVEILSTGGTARILEEAGVAVREVSDLTGFPEIMDGRVKTLHPTIHGGLLAIRDNDDHGRVMSAHGIVAIDLLVVNLYAFEDTVGREANFAECIENIDIGGPAMIRSAAKNHDYVSVVIDPADYARLMDAIATNGGLPSDLRRELAAKAFARTAAYDAAIASWFSAELEDAMPERLVLQGRRRQLLRYGENPHQEAAFYVSDPARPGVGSAEQVQGKDLSYNNIADADAAFALVAEFDPGRETAVAIIKHANPCGVARGTGQAEAYLRALACDPVSAFGGVVAVNRALDAGIASEIAKIFTEVVIAPGADDEAREILRAKKNLRLLLTGTIPDHPARGLVLHTVCGGFLAQEIDGALIAASDLRVVTRRQPGDSEIADLLFAFTVCKHVKSNAIVYARDGATVGIGAGQMSRVDSSRMAAWKAAEAARQAGGAGPSLAEGSVVASDAFFPFADGLLAAAEAGATAVIQPGGSIRDDEVIRAADDAGLAMVFTGRRHFRH